MSRSGRRAAVRLAALLTTTGTRRVGGALAAAFFVAVFPGNVTAVRVLWANPVLRAAAIARLPLQVPLVTQALAARDG